MTDAYSPEVIRLYERTTERFCTPVTELNLSSVDVDGRELEALREAVLRDCSRGTHAKFCLERFLAHLVAVGAVSMPVPTKKKPTAMEQLREEYDAYLRHQRGMSDETVYHCMRFLERFMTFRFGTTLGNLNAITPDDIVNFLGQLRAGSQPACGKGRLANRIGG